MLLHEVRCRIADLLLDFQGDRRRMAGRAGRSGDGHGAGSAGGLVVRAGTAATEQMKKDRHDAEKLQASHAVPPSPATAE